MIGEKLKQLRIKNDYTQQQVADLLGIARGTYAHYEIDKRQPDFDTLKKISNLFSVSTDFLLGHEISSNPVNDPSIKKGYDLLEKANDNLSDPDKRALIDLMETYLKLKNEKKDN